MASRLMHRKYRSRLILGSILFIVVLAVLAAIDLPGLVGPQGEGAFLDRQKEALRPESTGHLDGLEKAPRYWMKARIDPQNGSLDGQVTAAFTNTGREPLSELFFRLYPNADSIYGGGSLRVESAAQEGKDLRMTLSEAGTVLSVHLNRPLPPGQTVSVDLVFSAQAPTFPGKGYGIFSRSDRVLFLAGWYPVLAFYDQGWQIPPIPQVGDALQAETSFYDVELEVPAGYEVVSTGTVIATDMSAPAGPGFEGTLQTTMSTTGQNGTQSPPTAQQAPQMNTWYTASGPAREFVLAISRDFEKLETQVAGVTLRSYTLPAEDPNTTPEKSLELLSSVFQAMTDYLGPYPYAEFDLVETPITIGGYEFSGLVTIDDEARLRGGPSGYEYLMAHEVAHQWWYGLVGTPTVEEPWLDEAHATYSAVLYLQHAGRPEAAQALLTGWKEEIASSQEENLPVETSARQFSDWGFYRRTVYTRGALFLDDLRQSMGDEEFFELLVRFQETYRYRQGTTLDYLRMAEEISGEDLERLYGEYFGEQTYSTEPGS